MSATTTISRALLVEAFRAAKAAAEAADPGEGQEHDGGTCNFDAPAIKMPGVRESFVEECATEAGVRVSAFKWLGGKRWFWVHGVSRGQANRRTRMAEAACKALSDAGLTACMYMQAD